MPDTAEESIHHRFVAEKVVPLVIPQAGCDDRGAAMIALFHQLEESVRLFGLEIEIAELIDKCSAEHLSINVKLSEMWS
jgi:hypothetical protein